MFGSFNTFGHMVTKPSFGHSHNSRPTHGNACSPNAFMSHMNAQGFNTAGPAGVGGAILGGISGGPAGAFTGGVAGYTSGFLGGFVWGFAQKAHECWF
ncbi:hypothetical protein [Bartonella sp. AU18XJBT]|uniref:hypothetical protein n=1 Tax=Bartonella sp. AU18XJBT TaxID=3019089 RepID=UPI002360D882|nr:hypothetical protein [Bartonella sp. AU18XJBT]